MASKRICELPDWSSGNINWYILSNKETVQRIRHRKNAPAGRIFQVDRDDPDKSCNDGIELKSCEKGEIRVKWRPGVFYGLDDDLKEMLIAVEGLKERLWIFEEHAELLMYAKELKIGDKVNVRVPVKNISGIVQGTVKYIGPKDPKTRGKYFGIQLDCNLDDSVGVNYSWCKGGKGVLVEVNKIQPPQIKKHDSKPRTRRDQKPEEYTMNKDADVGVKDSVLKPPYIKADDDVFANVRLTSCPSRKIWVKGKLVFSMDNHVAVNVDSAEGRILTPWKGWLNGKTVFTNCTNQTAWIERNDVQILHDKPLHHENSSPSTWASNKQRGGTSSETYLTNQPLSTGSAHRIPPGTNISEKERCTSDTKASWTSIYTNLELRADPPPYPFSLYEVKAIVADSKLCHGLISALELTDKWRATTKKEQKDFFRLESVLQSWWKDMHAGHQAHLQSFLMFLGQYGREDIRDHIEKVPDRGCFDETVLNTVILSATKSWKMFAAELGVQQRELTGKLTQDMNPYDCLRTVFDIWNTNEKGCNKLSQLLKACRAIGRDTLAEEIEQGLNELVLRRIGHQIETKQLRLLGEKLLISDVRLDAFRETFKHLPERVYRMFSYWSMLQSFDANKIEMLVSVLYDIGLGHVAEKELYKGLRQHELENTAALLSDNWQKLASVLVKTQDIDYIMEQKGDSSQNCFRMLNIWRSRQIRADDVNMKETLFQAMSQCNLYREARQLYDGLDPYTVMELSVKLLFDWPLLASYFGYKKVEIAERMRCLNQAEMALKMLNEWLNANKDENPRKTKEKLLEGFVTIRREDLVEWLQNRDDGVCEVSGLKQMAQKATPESKRLTRMNMQKVAEKLYLNQQQLMDMLTLNNEDFKRYKSDSIKEDHPLAVIVAWKKKQSQRFGELETFENLQKLLNMYEHREALAELSEVTNRSERAVGGVPPEEPLYPDLTLDSLVEVNYGEQTLPGVIAWIGDIKGIDGHGILAGVELDNYLDVGGTDGTFNGTRCFYCQYGKGLILPLSRCKPDSRFLAETEIFNKKEKLTKDVPDGSCFDETVLNTVILSATNSWKLFAAKLGVEKHELFGKLTQDMNPYDCLRTAFDIWNTNEKECNKLGQLLKACRAIGRDTLADEIEQGLNESVLRQISHKIERKHLKLLGEELLISEVRLDAFRQTFKILPERVYRMFSYWSMLQSFDANKIEMLASVLYDIGLGHVAEKELYKGLRQHELENTAALLFGNWQKLASVLVKPQDIDYIMEQKGDSPQNCFRMLKIWRGRKIQADDGNLKETLFEAMCQCDLYREARQLYYGPPPYPFSDFHIEVITDDKKLCQGLIKGLQLENKWKAEKGREVFFRLEYVLQQWWTQIYEESKTQMQEFKILLVQYGQEDLRDHIDKVPDRGMFDDTILNTAIFLARKDWRKFASELGMKQNDIDEKLKQDVLPEESLKIVFHIWYKQEQGCSKLSKLVKACRSIGQHTLAEEIEQGLSDVMFRKIADQIELKSWQRLADHLLISPVRQDAFREKFKSLPNRVYHMLSYWSMIQPFGTDKVDRLASALYDVKLGYVAQTLLYRDFGGKDCEPVEGYVDPPMNVDPDRIGMFKGIQGVHNSSYMDATLFSMFAYNSVFDAILLYDESTKEDILEIKNVLRRTIVNPLRSIGYVRADYMLYFCDLLRGLDILQGLQAEEKDPAEFIQALLQELFNLKPFLQISQGQNTTMESFMYQIFLDKQDNSDTSTVSDLLHLSFLQSDLKLAKVPECLIIQLHKYGKKYKLYDWIIPSLMMDINTLIRGSPRQCSDCGKLAYIECKDCTPVATDEEDTDVIQSFCRDCNAARHKRKRHRITNLSVPLEVTKMFQEIAEKVDEDDIAEKTQHLYPEHRMELFSVVCIETSHYVAFVKTGSGDCEHWLFFDSIADRQGEQHGYNIPEVVHLKNFRQQMESDSLRRDMKRHDFSKYLKRLLSDAYICFYRPVKNRTSSNMDIISQTTHVRSAQGNGGCYSESNQSILQPHHSLGHTDSTYQQTFNQEPTSQQVPPKSSSNQRIEPEERRVMSQGFGDRALSRGQQYDNLLYDQVANISADKGTHQNTRCADEITDENRMDWESSENRGKCDSSQQSGGASYYRTPQHSQNSGHLKDHDIDQQSRNSKSNQTIGQLSIYNSDRYISHLSLDNRYTGVNHLGSRSDNIRSQGVSTKHENENLKGQRSNNDLKTSQQKTLTYPISTYSPNRLARNKYPNEQQDERLTHQTTPGNSFATNQDSTGSSTTYRKAALPHSQRDGLEVNMTQNINPQCDSMSPHASLNRDQAGSSKGKSIITPDHIKSQNLPGNQTKGEMTKSSEDDRSGSSYYSELRIDSSVSDDIDISSYSFVFLDDTSLARNTSI